MFSILFAIKYSSKAQTVIVGVATHYISKYLEADVSISRVDIEFFHRLSFDDFYVSDQSKDTLLYAQKLKTNFDLSNITKGEIIVDKVFLEHSHFNLKYLIEEEKSNLQFILDVFSSGKKDTTKVQQPITVDINELFVKDFNFKYFKASDEIYQPNVINFKDIAISDFNLHVKNFSVDKDTVRGEIQNLNFKEKSGFQIRKASTDLTLHGNIIDLKNLKLKTPNSDINSDLSLNFTDWSDFADFVEKVELEADFNNSKLDFYDIAHFTEELQGLKKQIKISGNYTGPISNINGKNVLISFGQQTRLRGDAVIRGLPDVENTFFQFSVNRFVSNKKDLETIPIPPFDKNNYLILPENFDLLKNFTFTGNFTGFYYDFVATGNLSTALGDLYSDVALVVDENKKATYKGNIEAKEFNFGKFFDVKDLQQVSLKAKINGEGFTKEDLNVKVKGKVTKGKYLDYEYKNIELDGRVADKIFNGNAKFEDPNLNFDFSGIVDFSNEDLPKFNFEALINNADLKALNIRQNDSISKLSCFIDIDFEGSNLDNLKGFVNISDIDYQLNEEVYVYENINLQAKNNDNKKELILSSDIINFNIKGNYALEKLPLTLEWLFYDIVKLEESKIEGGGKRYIPANQIFEYGILIKDFSLIRNLFVPFLSFSDNTTIGGKINTNTSEIDLKLISDEFEVYGNKFDKLYVDLKLDNKIFYLNTNANKLNLTDSISIDNFAISSVLKSDTLDYHIAWNNEENVLKNSGNIEGEIRFENLSDFDVKFNKFDVIIADSVWRMSNNNLISINNKDIAFSDFKFISDNQQLSLQGMISELEDETFSLIFSNFNLENFNILTQKANIEIAGIIDGEASLSNVYSDLFFNSNLDITNLVLNGENLGSGKLNSKWNNSTKAINLDGALQRNDLNTLTYKGYYLPTQKEDNINIELELARLKLDLFQYFVEGTLSDLNGLLSGKLTISGSTSKPDIAGEMKFQKASFKVDFLNTVYNFSGPVTFKENEISLNNLAVFDGRTNIAVISGKIRHENYKNFNLNINAITDKFMVLNTTAKQNDLYYGTAFMTGRVGIIGPIENIVINVNARTDKGTTFNIPLGGSQEVVQSNFITFISHDTTGVEIEEEKKLGLTGIILNFELDITPDAEVQLIFDPTIGDIIRGRGLGHLKLELNSSGDFNMYGDFNIESGDYLFTLMNVINKRFKVDKGGSIKWNGDPYNANIDISAVYKLRTSLFDLGAAIDTSRKRVPVECVLRMTDELMSPNIDFDIRLPTSDEITKTKLQGILMNEQERERQVFALLTMNRFVTPQDMQFAGAGQDDVNHAGIGATSSSEFLSNQLSNWLSRISDDFDLGVNYRPGDEASNEEFEVAVSTQMFNDRLVIDGNIGMQNQQNFDQQANAGANQNASNFVGDFVVEYKISQDGRFRLKAFNQANNFNLINTNSPYTQGVGVFYRKDFNDFNDFIKNYFSSRQPSVIRLEEEDEKRIEKEKKEKERKDKQQLNELDKMLQDDFDEL